MREEVRTSIAGHLSGPSHLDQLFDDRSDLGHLSLPHRPRHVATVDRVARWRPDAADVGRRRHLPREPRLTTPS